MAVTRFGSDLVLLDRIAAGGMAEVYRARQLGYGGFEKSVAIKRILPNYAADEDFKHMFQQEANLCAGLQHPNIVQVFANGEAEGYLYLVMEFVDGKNLRQLLSRCDKKKIRIPVEIATYILIEAAKGLSYAHTLKDDKTGTPLEIIHRDMSPQNIMLSYEGAVKIVDFGIAKAAAHADNTRAGVLKGKFGYMSPEQAHGKKLDQRTDIFALGIILFELLTQRRLFSSDDDMKTLNLVRECRVPRASKYNPLIPPTLDQIVTKALAKERAERYQSAQDLFEELQLFMAQKYPRFLASEFSRFFKEAFAADIVEDRKRREKMAAEAPAILGQSPHHQRSKEAAHVKKEDLTQEMQDESRSTELSGLQDAEPHPDFKELKLESLEEQKGALKSAKHSKSGEEAVPQSSPPPPLRGAELDPTQVEEGKVPMPPPIQQVSAQAVQDLLKNFSKADIPSVQPQRSSNYLKNNSPTIGPSAYEKQLESMLPKARSSSGAWFTVTLIFAAAFGMAYIGIEKYQSDYLAKQKTKELKETVVAEVAPHSDRKVASDFQSYSEPRIGGYISVQSFPAANEIYLNGQLLVDSQGTPYETPLRRLKVAPGHHKLELKSTIFGKSISDSLPVRADEITSRDYILK